MTTLNEYPSYSAVQQSLRSFDILTSASEAHGLMVGLLCGTEPVDLSYWLNILVDEPPVQPEDLQHTMTIPLAQLLSASQAQLQDLSDDNRIDLLLPPAATLLGERTQSLGEWCQGFMTGLGLTGCYINQNSSQDNAEALHDISEIAKIGGGVDGGEEEEHAFAEVRDYVALAVTLIQRSLQETLLPNEAEVAETLH